MRLGLPVWQPYRGLNLFSKTFDKLFDDVPGSFFGSGNADPGGQVMAPRVDIYESEHGYTVSADLPGMQKRDVRIDIDGNTLTIRGERKYEQKSEEDSYVLVERKYGAYLRSFTLSEKVDKEKIKASYRDGVLEIQIPKRADAKTRQIKVDAN